MLLTLALGCFLRISAGNTDSVQIGFRQSHFNIDMNFEANGIKLDSIFRKIASDSSIFSNRPIRSVKVTGAASPEGSVRFNNYLSQKRAEAIFNSFRTRNLLPDSAASFTFLGRDWQGLRREVLADLNTPSRSEVLALLDEIISNPQKIAHPLSALKSLDNGIPYVYLYNNIFPTLRRSQIILTYNEKLSPIPSTLTSFRYTQSLPSPEPVISPSHVKPEKPFYMAVKTNMLYDAALLPNIGAEFYVGKNWSVFGDWMYGWWDKDSSHYYWRAYGGSLGLRRWFGTEAERKPLTGHHLGAFGGIVTFDFELGGKGYMGGIPHGTLWDRCCWLTGIEYGYSLPATRRLNIDFSLALGYLHGKLVHYVPNRNFYQWQKTSNLNWVGPVKIEIALVWLIGRGNVNSNK